MTDDERDKVTPTTAHDTTAQETEIEQRLLGKINNKTTTHRTRLDKRLVLSSKAAAEALERSVPTLEQIRDNPENAPADRIKAIQALKDIAIAGASKQTDKAPTFQAHKITIGKRIVSPGNGKPRSTPPPPPYPRRGVSDPPGAAAPPYPPGSLSEGRTASSGTITVNAEQTA
jgi:hypothetical protein